MPVPPEPEHKERECEREAVGTTDLQSMLQDVDFQNNFTTDQV